LLSLVEIPHEGLKRYMLLFLAVVAILCSEAKRASDTVLIPPVKFG
jgi:hypothetical protein